MNKSINILIVEDNVLIADDMQMILEDMGYNVLANVTSYEKAVEVLKNESIDLALLDIQLATEKSGIDIGRYIRENLDIPFVFVTSNSDVETVNNAKNVKPNGYLVKPFQEYGHNFPNSVLVHSHLIRSLNKIDFSNNYNLSWCVLTKKIHKYVL